MPIVTSPVNGSITAPSPGAGLKVYVPPGVTTVAINAPTHEVVIVKLGSSSNVKVTSKVVVAVQGPLVVYSIVYVAPAVPIVISPVIGSITAPSPGGGLKEKVPPGVATETIVAPTQEGVILKLGSSVSVAVTDCVEEAGQGPFVVYKTSYVFPDVPLVIIPVLGSITAASIGGVLKENVPPTKPVTFDTPPSQVAVIVKLGSSIAKAVNGTFKFAGQTPCVVYNISYVAPGVPFVTSPVTELI